MKLQYRLNQLLTKEASELEFSKLLKEEYQLYLSELRDQFLQTRGKNFHIKHTKSTEQFVKIIYKYILRNYFGTFLPLPNQIPFVLFTMGSFAREELSVYSDLDLLIVYEDIKGYRITDIIEAFLRIAWDSGLKLKHRVHTVDQLLEASREDISIKTALLESRFLIGSNILSYQTTHQVERIRLDHPRDFIQTKISEYYHRHDTIPIEMRAHLKEGAGGLRDINTLIWIAKVTQNSVQLKTLTPYFEQRDIIKLQQAIDYLYRFRAALHLCSGKQNDTVRLELIPEIAHLLGTTQQKSAKRLFKALNDIKTYTHLFITKLSADYLPLPMHKAHYLNQDLFIIDRKLYAGDTLPTQDTLTILSFVLAHESKIDSYNITFVQYLKNSKFANQNGSQNHLVKALFYHTKLYRLLMALYYAKKVLKILPPLLKVRDLPQFDGYHRYPVDLHSLRTMKAIEAIDEPLIASLLESLTPDLKATLKLATLLHDSGKGRNQDHSILGSHIVKHYLYSLGFNDTLVAIASRLVRYHTLMSNTAAREDIYNEKVIYAFNAKIKDPLTLKMLYILTYCDIESVGKGTYNNFNATLLRQLYEISLEAFENDAMINEATKRERIEKRLKKYPAFLQLQKTTQKRILRIPSNLLFFKYTLEEISNLATWVQSREASYEFHIHHDTHLIIQILATQPLNVGYLLGKLVRYDITTMDIFKIEQGLKYFLVAFEKNIQADEKLFVEEVIHQSFDMQKNTPLPNLELKPKEISIDCNHSNTYASMRVHTKDQRGLVANIIKIFDDMGIDIASAKIQTMKNRARNLFLIEKNGKFCNTTDIIMEKLTKKGK